jgi:hypothetical protein
VGGWAGGGVGGEWLWAELRRELWAELS